MSWDFEHHVAVFNRAVTSGKWAETVGLFSADATMEFPGTPVPPILGRDAIAAAYAADGPTDTIELTAPPARVGDEDVVAYRWRDTGRTGTMRARSRAGRLDHLVVTFD